MSLPRSLKNKGTTTHTHTHSVPTVFIIRRGHFQIHSFFINDKMQMRQFLSVRKPTQTITALPAAAQRAFLREIQEKSDKDLNNLIYFNTISQHTEDRVT